jgi:ADP-ribose pyrophosphatase YjhB (NUDIX family)
MATLYGWRYCPRCAAELDLDHAPARVECPRCGFVGYANSKPCACALVEDGEGRILLGRRAVPPDQGLWDILGGYLEEHEHPLDGLHRELLEETGLTIEPTRFLGVFMGAYGHEPDASETLNLIWTARIVGGEPVAGDDVAELRWFAADELPGEDELAFDLLPGVFEAWRAAS